MPIFLGITGLQEILRLENLAWPCSERTNVSPLWSNLLGVQQDSRLVEVRMYGLCSTSLVKPKGPAYPPKV